MADTAADHSADAAVDAEAAPVDEETSMLTTADHTIFDAMQREIGLIQQSQTSVMESDEKAAALEKTLDELLTRHAKLENAIKEAQKQSQQLLLSWGPRPMETSPNKEPATATKKEQPKWVNPFHAYAREQQQKQQQNRDPAAVVAMPSPARPPRTPVAAK